MAALQARIATYSEPHFKDFFQCVSDAFAFREDWTPLMHTMMASFAKDHPDASVKELQEKVVAGVIGSTKAMLKQVNDEKTALEKKCRADVAAVNKQLEDLQDSLVMINGESKLEFYKNKFHEQLVCRPGTNEPIVCPYTGQVTTKSKQYQDERDRALADLERVKQLMPSDETNALLLRTKKKAQVFKRKYKYVKSYLNEDQYMSNFSDGHCDTDKGHSEDSDDDLRAERAAVVRVFMHDPSIPMGFSVRPASPDAY